MNRPIVSTKRRGAIRDTRGDHVFKVSMYMAVGLVMLVTLYPLVFVLSASISSSDAVASGRVYLWPVGFDLTGFKLALAEKDVIVGFKNSLFYTALGVLINMSLTILLAFPLSRKHLPGRGWITFVIAFTMYFSGGLIPTYLLMDRFKLVDTVWGLLLPNAISSFNMIIMRTYFQSSIPDELQESAWLDGCNDTRFLLRIVLPLSMPILAVVGLYYAVSHWNGYFNALIYLRSQSKISLQLALRHILLANQAGGGDASYAERAMIGVTVKYAVIVISCIPMMIIYPFVQKFFLKGVMVGAIKG